MSNVALLCTPCKRVQASDWRAGGLFPLLWILSTSEPCGFFPLADSVLSVLFSDAVDSLHVAAVWILLMTPGYQLSVTPLSS